MSNMFSPDKLNAALDILKHDIPLAIWETFYVTLVSTLFAFIIGLPLGVLLVCGDRGGVLPLPRPLMKVINKTYRRYHHRLCRLDSSSCDSGFPLCRKTCGEQSARGKSEYY